MAHGVGGVVPRAVRGARLGDQRAEPASLRKTKPNKGLELTASSVRSSLAPASGSRSGLALL
jgi:hypothetical protein